MTRPLRDGTDDDTMTEWDSDLAFALSCAALRYALGRRSAAPSMVADTITRRVHLFRVNDLTRMGIEITDALWADQAGDECDQRTWRTVVGVIAEELTRREGAGSD